MSTIPQRLANAFAALCGQCGDVVVPLNPAERALYDAVEEHIGTTYNDAAANDRPSGS